MLTQIKMGQVATEKQAESFWSSKRQSKSITPDYDKDGVSDFRDIQRNFDVRQASKQY
ncbi:MAG: hypothetical protein IPL95_12005 [Saprospiraceae bacterium]|nr:hypothetical protein [Saprospiraceae bacterium]